MSSLELEILHAGNYQYERGCKNKIQCQTEAEAKRGARAMHKIFHKKFDSYACKFCGFFHVGSRGRRPAA